MDSYEYHTILELQTIFRETREDERRAANRDAEMTKAMQPQGARRGR